MKKAEKHTVSSISQFVHGNKILIITGSIAIISWIIPKSLTKLTLPINRDENKFEIAQETKRLKANEIDLATNYGFKAGKIMMDKGDRQLRPEILVDNLGNKNYRYMIKKGETQKTTEEVEKQAIEFKKKIRASRELIKYLLKTLRGIGVTVAIGDPGKPGAAAVWSPKKQTIRISEAKMKQGSLAVLRVLNHEAVHVAQSCANGGINYKVLPLGVEISAKAIYNNQIQSKIYTKATREIKMAEKEAYSYEYSTKSAIYFIRKYCKTKR